MKCFRCGRDEACEKRQEVPFDYRGFCLTIRMAPTECFDCARKASIDRFEYMEEKVPGLVKMQGAKLLVDWRPYLCARNLGRIGLPNGQILGDAADFMVMVGILSLHCRGNYEIIRMNPSPPHFTLKPRSRHSGLYFTKKEYAQSYSDIILADCPGKKSIVRLATEFGEVRLEYVAS